MELPKPCANHDIGCGTPHREVAGKLFMDGRLQISHCRGKYHRCSGYCESFAAHYIVDGRIDMLECGNLAGTN
jgi:hypothetical protein